MDKHECQWELVGFVEWRYDPIEPYDNVFQCHTCKRIERRLVHYSNINELGEFVEHLLLTLHLFPPIKHKHTWELVGWSSYTSPVLTTDVILECTSCLKVRILIMVFSSYYENRYYANRAAVRDKDYVKHLWFPLLCSVTTLPDEGRKT